MSVGAGPGVHPTVAEAARGVLPGWAEATPGRRAHMERVARLLAEWADALDLDPAARTRWRAAGWLHDALRDAPPASLRTRLPETLADLPDPVLHGPAAAAALRAQGVEHEGLLRAVAWHTLGHPELDRLGRAVYAADFLEPGRSFRPEWRAGLRARMPHELPAVLREIVAARIAHQVEAGGPLRQETVAFWNALLAEG